MRARTKGMTLDFAKLTQRAVQGQTPATGYRLAKMMGVTPATVYRWLDGSRRPDCDNAVALVVIVENVERRNRAARHRAALRRTTVHTKQKRFSRKVSQATNGDKAPRSLPANVRRKR